MGYWGEAGTTVTWKNPTVTQESQRQSGGWYYNPATGRVDRWWTGSQPTTTSGGGGSTSTNNYQSQIDQQLAQQRAAEEAQRKRQEEARAKELAYYGQAKQEEQGLLGRYTTAIQNLEPLTAIRQRLGTEFNLPSLQQASDFLTTTLENIPGSVKNLAGQFGISAPRMEQRMQSLAANITPAQQQAVRQEQTAQERLADTLKYEVAQQERQLLPYTQEFTVLKDRIARESAGFTTENKAQLDLLLQELKTTGTLTEQKLLSARELALKEEDYNLEKMKLENAREVITADGRVKLINSLTGELIRDLGSSRSGTGGAGGTSIDMAADEYDASQATAAKDEKNLSTVGQSSVNYSPVIPASFMPANYTPASYPTASPAPSLSQQVSNFNFAPLPGTPEYATQQAQLYGYKTDLSF